MGAEGKIVADGRDEERKVGRRRTSEGKSFPILEALIRTPGRSFSRGWESECERHGQWWNW